MSSIVVVLILLFALVLALVAASTAIGTALVLAWRRRRIAREIEEEAAPWSAQTSEHAVETAPAAGRIGARSGVALSDDPEAAVSRRYRLWRDSAAILLAACVAALGVTMLVPSARPPAVPVATQAPTEVALALGASPAASSPQTASSAPASATPPPSSRPRPAVAPGPTRSPGHPAAPESTTSTGVPAPSSSSSPRATPTPRPTPIPTPRPTPPPTPGPTPPPTPPPTPRPTPPPTPAPTPTPPPPTASFTFSCAGSTVTFAATTIDGATYAWDFGDGSSDTGRSPSHTYAADGAHHVVLTVARSGASDSATQDVTTPCP